jgi:hypothetical protein
MAQTACRNCQTRRRGVAGCLRQVSPAFAAGLAEGQASPYIAPESPRSTVNFNLDWRFFRDEVKDADAVTFDDSKWATINKPFSLPKSVR